MATQLPDANSSHLSLTHPTEEEKTNQFNSNGASWRGALSMEAYHRREAFLARQALTRENGITYWVLVDTAVTPRKVLAGCETLRKHALVSRKGKLTDCIAHGVCSVFTPPENRGKGYGARMIAELGKKLKTWQNDKGEVLLSVLYSDIGKQFYATHGWRPCPSSHIHLPPRKEFFTTLPEKLPTKPLHTYDLPKLCAADEALIRTRLSKHATSKPAVALVPNHATIAWHHAREEFVGNELYGEKPLVKGAMAHVAGGKRVWCIWTRVWANEDPLNRTGNTLHVLRLVIEDETLQQVEEANGKREAKHDPQHVAAIEACLRAAQAEADKWHMEVVEVWNPHARTVRAAQIVDPAARVEDRDTESITSLKWYGEGDGNVEWLENEKYGWC